MEKLFAEPVIQYGFAGFAAALLGIVVWLVRRLLAVLDQNTKVIADNTETIRQHHSMTADLLVLVRDMREKLLVVLSKMEER